MNAQGILAWESDVAPLATITVDVAWEIDIDVTTEVNVGGFDYDLNWTIVGSGTVQFVYTKEAPNIDDVTTVTTNKFTRVAGETAVGSPGADVPPFFRGCYVNIYPKNNSLSNGPLFDEEKSGWSVDWSETYTPINMGDPPGPDDSGTETGNVLLTLALHQSGNQISWTAAFALVGIRLSDAWPQGSLDFNGDITGDFTIGPVTVAVETLKTGGSVDIGGTANQTEGNPTNWDTVTTFVNTWDMTVTCS